MERAKLIIKETKRKKLVAEVCFEKDSKTMSVPKFTPKDTTLNGKMVQVERKKGQIVRVLDGEHILFSTGETTISASKVEKKNMRASKTTNQREENFREFKHIRDVRYPAHAPYNFVPLNSQVVSIPREEIPAFIEKKNKRKFNKYWKDRKTGWIQLDIETKTPIYIRDTLNPEEMQIKQKSENDDKKNKIKKRYINSDFFSPGGRFQIPGSSLRGMIRNILEIVSFGKFENFDDQRLYYRGLADRSNLRTEYQQKMSSYDSKGRRPLYKANAGILKKDGMDYTITPTSYKPVSKEKREKGYKPFNFYKIREGYWIVSGDTPNKKRDWLILFPEDGTELIPVSREDVKNYINDEARGKNVPNLIDLAAAHEEVPCFYVTWKDKQGKKRISFGHTVMFRLAYEKSTEEHIPVPAFQINDSLIDRLNEADLSEGLIKKIMELEKKKYTRKELMDKLDELNLPQKDINTIMNHASIIDLAEAIFGNEKTFAGRVFFENAYINDEHGNELNGESVPDILSSPKPTTFQHYLAQTSDEIRQLNNYNTAAPIRGYKLYWHKSGKQWEEKDKVKIKQILDSKKILNSLREIDEKVDSQHTIINPLKPGTHFTGKIRFENLSLIELGALLFCLDIPQGCYHKIGIGKPLGLGTIKITPKLYCTRRETRYKKLFNENVWEDGIDELLEIDDCKNMFEEYVLEKIGEKNIQSLWKTERLQDLKSMLDYELGIELESKGMTRYMEIEKTNEFKNRPVLPMPSDLRKKIPNKVNPIKRIKIERLWDQFDIDLKDLDPRVNILIGKNGTGKTTILRVINLLLNKQFKDLEREHIKSAWLLFKNGNEIKYPLEDNYEEITVSCEFISTFDIPIENSQVELKVKEYVDTQLNQILPDKIDLYRRIKSTKRERFEFLKSEKMEFLAKQEQKSLENIEKRFADLVNCFFKETKKRIDLIEDGVLVYLQNGEKISFDKLSTGEKQILIIFFQIFNQALQNPEKLCFVLLDEPENSMHLEWQEQLIDTISKINERVQFIIVTHSPGIVKRGWWDKAIGMDDVLIRR